MLLKTIEETCRKFGGELVASTSFDNDGGNDRDSFRCVVSLAEKGEVWCLASLFALGLDPTCRHPDSGKHGLLIKDCVYFPFSFVF